MRELDDRFKYKNITLKVVRGDGCEKCYFNTGNSEAICVDNPTFIGGECSKNDRRDRNPVIFIFANNFKYGK